METGPLVRVGLSLFLAVPSSLLSVAKVKNLSKVQVLDFFDQDTRLLFLVGPLSLHSSICSPLCLRHSADTVDNIWSYHSS